MATVRFVWEGNRAQGAGTELHTIPIDVCIRELGLHQDNYWGREIPTMMSDNPRLDDYRDARGVVVNLKADEAPPGWKPGWYLILIPPANLQKVRDLFDRYPGTSHV